MKQNKENLSNIVNDEPVRKAENTKGSRICLYFGIGSLWLASLIATFNGGYDRGYKDGAYWNKPKEAYLVDGNRNEVQVITGFADEEELYKGILSPTVIPGEVYSAELERDEDWGTGSL